jgi:hypothetical protein
MRFVDGVRGVTRALGPLLVLAGAGCGVGAPACHTGAQYECMKPMTAEEMPCGHPFTTVGKFDSPTTGKTCTFPDGSVIEWPTSAFASSPSDHDYHFTITTGGAECMRFDMQLQGTVTTTTVHTSAGTYQELQDDRHILPSYTTICPDGVTTFNDAEARTCAHAFRHLAYAYERSNSNVRMALGTAGASVDSFELFACGP